MYRMGGDHVLVTEGIRRLAETVRKKGSSPAIEIQFLLHRGNEHEVSAAAEFAESIGAGFKIKSMQVLDNQRAGEWMPSDRQMSRYTLSGKEWKTTGAPSRGCMRMWTTSVITSDGDVVPCCFDKNASHVMGNLNSQSFKKIWQSEKYIMFRKAVMKSRMQVDICRECPEGRRIFFKD
jgi:radical SAM protein with 4Fe4S-binding SPASM domain